MTVHSPPPPVELVRASVTLGDRDVDLATRALVVATVPDPTWGRESEVIAAVRAAAEAGADLAEVPGEPRLAGPAAAAGHLPVAVRVRTGAEARAAVAAGASLLLAPVADHDAVRRAEPPEGGGLSGGGGLRRPVVVLADSARGAREARDGERDPDRPEPVVGIDTLALSGVDIVAEASLALAVGARVVRTRDVRRARRVVEVMAALLEARR